MNPQEVVQVPPAYPGGPSFLALARRQRVSLAALTEWARERTCDPRVPMLKLEGPAGMVRFWVIEVPVTEPTLTPGFDTKVATGWGKDAYVRTVTCAQVDLSARGYAFESATEEHPDPDRGRRIALQRALEASGATRESRLGFWGAYEQLFGKRGS